MNATSWNGWNLGLASTFEFWMNDLERRIWRRRHGVRPCDLSTADWCEIASHRARVALSNMRAR